MIFFSQQTFDGRGHKRGVSRAYRDPSGGEMIVQQCEGFKYSLRSIRYIIFNLLIGLISIPSVNFLNLTLKKKKRKKNPLLFQA